LPIATTTGIRDCDIAIFNLRFDINMSSDEELTDASSSVDM